MCDLWPLLGRGWAMSDTHEPVVRALTLRQPWATAAAVGLKTIEWRDWRTSYRGLLLLHAGRVTDDSEAAAAVRHALGPVEYPAGALVGVCRVARCLRYQGRWAWHLEDACELVKPIPWKGDRGLWAVPADAVRAALRAVGVVV